MYCKFCGNKIVSNASQCMRCGARINLADGGQSFYEENELDSWVADSGSNIPQTEIRPNGGRKIQNRKQQKSSGSSKLIVFGIAILVVVLLVVAVVYFSDKNDGKDAEQKDGSAATSSGTQNNDVERIINDIGNGKISTEGSNTSSDGSDAKDSAATDAKDKIAGVDKAEAEEKAKASKANANKNSNGNAGSKDKSVDVNSDKDKDEQLNISAAGGPANNSDTSSGSVVIPSISNDDGGNYTNTSTESTKGSESAIKKQTTGENAPEV